MQEDPVKAICRVIFDFTDKQLYDDDFIDIKDDRWFGLTPNQIIQFVKNDIFKEGMSALHPNFGKDIWVLCLNNKYEMKTSETKIIKEFKYNLPNIGVCGNKYHGKDTIADYLRDTYGYIKIAFADTLKEVCRIVFGLNDDQLYGDKKETKIDYWYGLTPRQILQFVGTELFRDNMSKLHEGFGKNIWLLCVKNKIKSGCMYVIPDVRFDNEIEFIKEMKGISIKVIRTNMTSTDTHASEASIDKLMTNVIIYNNGTKEQLYQGIDDIMKKIESSL